MTSNISYNSHESRNRSGGFLMNAKQKLHQANLQNWAILIQSQVDSGLTIRAWCDQNNISFNAYDYWKHLLKEEYVDSYMPDIVQVSSASSVPSQSKTQSQTLTSRESRDSHNPRHSYEAQPIRICTADADIAFSPSVTDDLILRVIKAVRYA